MIRSKPEFTKQLRGQRVIRPWLHDMSGDETSPAREGYDSCCEGYVLSPGGPNRRMTNCCGSLTLCFGGKMPLVIGFLCLAALCCAQPASPPLLKGAISGKLFDETGQPLPGWHVVAARWSYHRGRKELDLLPPGDTPTKDDGSFLIEDLDPGEYCLRAENPYRELLDLPFAKTLPALPTPKERGESYATTYYPGVVDASSASSIRVRAGAASSMPFRLQSARVFRIRGKIAVARGSMSIRPLDSFVPEDTRNVSASADGTFEVDGLLPGAYVISGSDWETASRVIVTVTDHDLTDVSIDAKPCPKVRGTFTLDGAPAVPKTYLGPVIPLSLLDEAMTVGGQVDASGAFTVACAQPENYSISVPVEPGQYVKSITIDGKDATYAPLDLTAFGDKTLDIAHASHAAELRGTVRDASGRPQPATPVTIWSARNDFNLTATSAADGTFQLGNLPPGNYRAAAWDQLYIQPSGWGVETVRDFRDQFTAAASAIVLGEGQRLSVDPVLIPRAAIEQAASTLRLNAVMNHAPEVDAIAQAVKSPQTLEHFLESNRTFDWTLVMRALGLGEDADWFAPCGDRFPAAQESCSVKIEAVSKPDQAILIVRGGDSSFAVGYLRYMRDSTGVWRFAGENSTIRRNPARDYTLMQFGDKPFLAIFSDQSQRGMGTQQVLEQWFDLTQPDFKPVFSITPDGGQSRFGIGVGRTIKTTYALHQTAGSESIQVTLSLHFNGVGLDQEATFIGVYGRSPGEKAFTLRTAYAGSDRRAVIPTEDFEGLADPFSDLSNEKLLAYAFAGLQKIAKGSDRDATEWLQSVLSNAEDTPEKRALLKLLKR